MYECILRQYTPEQIKSVDIENDFWALHKMDPQTTVKTFTIEAININTFVLKTREQLPAEIDWNKAQDIENKLKQLYEGLFEDYSQVWFTSMKDAGNDHSNRAEEVLTIILRDVVLAKCETHREEGKQILESFLSDNFRFPVFKKICLMSIDRYWENS